MSNYTLPNLSLYWNALCFYSEVSWANTISYYCSPRNPEALITESVWNVLKVITVTATGNLAAGKSVIFAGGSPDYRYPATDLNTVKALTYI